MAKTSGCSLECTPSLAKTLTTWPRTVPVPGYSRSAISLSLGPSASNRSPRSTGYSTRNCQTTLAARAFPAKSSTPSAPPVMDTV